VKLEAGEDKAAIAMVESVGAGGVKQYPTQTKEKKEERKPKRWNSLYTY